MAAAGNGPVLRLVNGGDVASPRSVRLSGAPGERRSAEAAVRAAAAGVRRENLEAATLAASDARWLLAVQVSQALEGGRAAVLPPERRRRLIGLGQRLGVGAFDANLVIAIVQDAARHGEGALSPATMSRLTLVREPRPAPAAGSGPSWGTVLAAAALGAALAAAMIRWIGA
jgi:hypothetical protein